MADLRTSTIVPTEEVGVATFSLEEQQPKEKTSWISIIVSVIAILLLGAVAYYLLFSNGKKGKKGKNGAKGNKYATPGTLQAPGSRPNGTVGDGKKDKNGGKGSKAPQRPPVDRPRPQPPVTTDPVTDTTDDAQIQPVPETTDTGTSFNIVTSTNTSVDDTITTADDTETNFTVTTDDEFETTVSVGDDVPFGRGSGDPVAIFRG